VAPGSDPSPEDRQPPPGRAQGLVARSGAVVYEEGRSLFDEPVLVYLGSSTGGSGVRFAVQDHVGQARGWCRAEPRRGLAVNLATEVFDVGPAPVLRVRPRPFRPRRSYRIEGVATALVNSSLGGRELSLEADGERLGLLRGSGLRGVNAAEIQILDHADRRVGRIWTGRERVGLLSRAQSYVLDVEPGLRGELRRLLAAAPVVIESIRRARARSG
jgi:hypothetical protein